MTNEQEKIISGLNDLIRDRESFITDEDEKDNIFVQDKTILIEAIELIKEQQEEIELIKEYVHQEIVHYTETIEDYEDDDKKGNKHYIEELKEKREHWRDVEKLLQNKPKEELYMNWWKYGLYE